MDIQRAFELMDIELQCIHRNKDKECDRVCEVCNLVQNTDELIEAYGLAKFALAKMMIKGGSNEQV